MALRAAVPDIRERVEKLVTIPGRPPSLREPMANCRFAARCPFATQECRDEPPPLVATSTGMVTCHHADRAEQFRAAMTAGTAWESSSDSA
jgi:oligopeptide/dipeptide ABC transporter ATP-binding protein